MTTPVATNKTKSPATPSYSLKDSYADAKKLYAKFSHASFSPPEIASALGMSSSSSSFTKRVFALIEYGMLDRVGDKFTVSKAFHTLDQSDSAKPDFQRVALSSIRRSTVFLEILADFKSKLPPEDVVAQRLERERGFNADRAKDVARILQSSLIFAGVIDANNNILPVRDVDPQPSGDRAGTGGDQEAATMVPSGGAIAGLRRTEIPLTDGRIAVVQYPHDLSSGEATKIGKVLAALVD
jgi:hypothetical protein